jgi:hypothetical protein
VVLSLVRSSTSNTPLSYYMCLYHYETRYIYSSSNVSGYIKCGSPEVR